MWVLPAVLLGLVGAVGGSELKMYGSCGTGCCGASFAVAVSASAARDLLAQLISVDDQLDGLNFTVKPPRGPSNPFVEYVASADGLAQGPAYIANFERSGSTEDGEVETELFDIAIFPTTLATAQVRLFSKSVSVGDRAVSWEDRGQNHANVQAWWKNVALPAYRRKPLTPFIGCTDNDNDDAGNAAVGAEDPAAASAEPSPEDTIADAVVETLDMGSPSSRVANTELSNPAFADVSSCGNACCGVAADVDITPNALAKLLNGTVAANTSYRFAGLGFAEANGSSIAEAVYTSPALPNLESGQTILNWVVGPGRAAGWATVRAFALCANGTGPQKVCVFDDGLGYQLHRELLAAIDPGGSDGEVAANMSVVFGCSTSAALPAQIGAITATTGSNVAGIVIFVLLTVLVVPWIRAASAKSPQFAAVPTRALYAIFFGILLYRIDHHGGFGPQTYSENGVTLSDAPSMNNHPVIVCIAVLVLLTEGLWATKTSPSMSMHFVFQTLAVVFVLIGVGTVVHIRNMQIAVGMKDQHFTSAHSWVGLIATILLSCHWIVGCVAFRLKHRFPFRHFYEPFHTLFGHMSYLTAIMAVTTGLAQYGHQIAILDGGACLDPNFLSMSCYDRTFTILTLVLVGVVITFFARTALTTGAAAQSQSSVGTTDV